jgi:hypothetical protein
VAQEAPKRRGDGLAEEVIHGPNASKSQDEKNQDGFEDRDQRDHRSRWISAVRHGG